ncbi:MAG: ROK family protein [Eubacterium sp.]|jgi:glucokinase|nr:ROK family protein [Eubacterium sp.]
MYNIGIDLGGTNIKIGVVDSGYNIVGKSSIKTAMPRSPEEIASSIAEGVTNLCKSNAINNIGIGTPGMVDSKTGFVLNATNLNFNNVPLGKMLSQKLNKKVFVENDANAAAYGEYLAGAGKSFKERGITSAVVITLGTGVGCGIIIDGKIFSKGSEVGHTVIVKDGVSCKCGRGGCFESYCSATGLIRMTKEVMEKNPDSKLWKFAKTFDDVNGKTAFDAMRKGDLAASILVNNFIEYLGCGITNIVNIFRPGLVLIGGGLSNEGDAIIGPLTEYVEREAFYADPGNFTKIGVAELGNDAGIIGASFLNQL